MTQEQAISEIRTKSSVPLWPTFGVAVGYSRCGTYALARQGKVEGLIEVGKRKLVATAPWRKRFCLADGQ